MIEMGQVGAVDSRTRFMIVGFGKMGQLHLQSLRRFSEATVVGVVDTDSARKATADAAGVAFSTAIGDLAASADAAIVATPAELHAPICLHLLGLGIDCLVEKPIALDPNEARRMVEAAGDRATLAVGQSERFNPGLELALGAMSNIIDDVIVRRTSRLPAEGSKADVIQDLMVHDLDWILCREAFASPGLEVTRAIRRDDKLADVTCRLIFGTGVYRVTALYQEGMPDRTVLLRPEGKRPRTFSLRQNKFRSGADPLTRQAASFLALRSGASAKICTGKQALQVLELIEQLRQCCSASLKPPRQN